MAKSRATYIPNKNIQSLNVKNGKRVTEIKNKDILDGAYVRKGVKFRNGGELFKKGGNSENEILKMNDGNYAGNKISRVEKGKKKLYYVVYVTKGEGRMVRLYDMKKNFVSEHIMTDLQPEVSAGTIKLIKRYDTPTENIEVRDIALKDMNYSELNKYIEDNYVDSITDSYFAFLIHETGDDINHIGESIKEQHRQIFKENCDFTEDNFESQTGYKIDGFEIQDQDGSELEEVASDNTYNQSYLGGADFNIRVYKADEEKYFLCALIHEGGDIRGGYGDAFIFEGESQDEVIQKFYGLISGSATLGITFSDGSQARFYSQQDSDVWYFEPSGDDLEGMAKRFTEDFESFGSWSGDEFLERTIELANQGKRIRGYAKGGRITISEIKERTSKTSPYFFDRKSMKFFGQRMSDFKTKKMSDGRIQITAPIKNNTGNVIGETKRFFNPETNELERYAKGGGVKKYQTEQEAFDIKEPSFQKFLKANNIESSFSGGAHRYDSNTYVFYGTKPALKKMLIKYWLMDESLEDANRLAEEQIEEETYKKGGGVGSRYNQWAKNIYENQAEEEARIGLMQFAKEEGFDYSDVEKALQTYKYDTEENAFGELYYTKKAIRNMISIISNEEFAQGGSMYAKGGGVSSKEAKAMKQLEKHIDYEFVNTDMGSGWAFSLDGFDLEMKYLDFFDSSDLGIEEDWDSLSKEDKDYYYEDWKESLWQSSYEQFKELAFKKYGYYYMKQGGNMNNDNPYICTYEIGGL